MRRSAAPRALTFGPTRLESRACRGRAENPMRPRLPSPKALRAIVTGAGIFMIRLRVLLLHESPRTLHHQVLEPRRDTQPRDDRGHHPRGRLLRRGRLDGRGHRALLAGAHRPRGRAARAGAPLLAVAPRDEYPPLLRPRARHPQPRRVSDDHHNRLRRHRALLLRTALFRLLPRRLQRHVQPLARVARLPRGKPLLLHAALSARHVEPFPIQPRLSDVPVHRVARPPRREGGLSLRVGAGLLRRVSDVS